MINGYEDINDNVKTQNGAWMTSWLSDHTEKLKFSILICHADKLGDMLYACTERIAHMK